MEYLESNRHCLFPAFGYLRQSQRFSPRIRFRFAIAAGDEQEGILFQPRASEAAEKEGPASLNDNGSSLRVHNAAFPVSVSPVSIQWTYSYS